MARNLVVVGGGVGEEKACGQGLLGGQIHRIFQVWCL